jgi:hypothetical protein
VAATALGPVGEVLVRVSEGRVFGQALIVGGIGAGDVQLRLRRRGVACRRQRWRLVLLHIKCVYMGRLGEMAQHLATRQCIGCPIKT